MLSISIYSPKMLLENSKLFQPSYDLLKIRCFHLKMSVDQTTLPFLSIKLIKYQISTCQNTFQIQIVSSVLFDISLEEIILIL